MVINNFPEIILINISQINLIKTYPEEKSNRIKVIVSWENGKKDYFYGVEEDINKIVEAWELIPEQKEIIIPTKPVSKKAHKKNIKNLEKLKKIKSDKSKELNPEKGITKKDIDKHMLENSGLKTDFGMDQEESITND